jgi:hypothetical protein
MGGVLMSRIIWLIYELEKKSKVLIDIGEEEKQYAFCRHSEKQAIAWKDATLCELTDLISAFTTTIGPLPRLAGGTPKPSDQRSS